MAARRCFSTKPLLPNPNANTSTSSPFFPLFNCKRRKKLKKALSSPRVNPIQPQPSRLPPLESILDRDAQFRFLLRTKSYLSRQPRHSLPLSAAGKLHHDLGFPRGRKLSSSASRHPLLLQLKPPNLSFTPLMESLLEEEASIHDAMEPHRIRNVRKLLMLSESRRIPLAKLHHCRHIFGLPHDFRDRVLKYPEFFRVDGHVLELNEWDPELAISALERDFVAEEEKVRKTFSFRIPHGRKLSLDEEEERRLNSLTTLPLVSPYSDGGKLKAWTVEAEKYRVGVVHELLSLTVEKRAMIHHIVEFKEEFGLTRRTYGMLVRQPRAFYLSGTEMNWGVFLRDAYNVDGSLKEKDPLVVFEEKLRRYAMMKEGEGGEEIVGEIMKGENVGEV